MVVAKTPIYRSCPFIRITKSIVQCFSNEGQIKTCRTNEGANPPTMNIFGFIDQLRSVFFMEIFF